jgi:hypothetical protein
MFLTKNKEEVKELLPVNNPTIGWELETNNAPERTVTGTTDGNSQYRICTSTDGVTSSYFPCIIDRGKLVEYNTHMSKVHALVASNYSKGGLSGVENNFIGGDIGRDGGGIEFRSRPLPYKQWKDLKNLKKMLEDLKDCGFAEWNSTMAGIHVHMDRSDFTFSGFMNMVKFLSTNRHFLISFTNRGISRSSASYPIAENYSGIDEARFNTGETSRMPIALNGIGCRTVEFRLFNSVLNYNRFMSFIEFCIAARNFSHQGKDISKCTMSDLAAYVAEKHPDMDFLLGELNKYGLVVSKPVAKSLII